MFFYTDYNPATDTRSVLSYDEKKHGMPRVVYPDMTFLYHGSLITSRVYNSAEDALMSWENTSMTYDEKREAVEEVLKAFCLANSGHDF